MPALPDPAPPPPTGASLPGQFQLHAHPPAARLAGAAAQIVSGASVLFGAFLVVFDVFTGAMVASPGVLVRLLVLFTLLPRAFVWLLHRLTRGTLRVEPSQLVLDVRGARFEIPLGSVAAARPWVVPLPGPGFSLRLKSGRSFRYGLEAADPTPLISAIGGAAGLAPGQVEHASNRFASARSRFMKRRWYHLALKYVLFPLLPTLLIFRAHQYITYGGALGEYYQLGLKAYSRTLFGYWSSTTAQLVFYAGVWRALAEVAALGAAWLIPGWSRGVRRVAEIACRLLYYVGVPALILARFLM